MGRVGRLAKLSECARALASLLLVAHGYFCWIFGKALDCAKAMRRHIAVQKRCAQNLFVQSSSIAASYSAFPSGGELASFSRELPP